MIYKNLFPKQKLSVIFGVQIYKLTLI
jgi:hypothetical protein